MFYLGLKGQNPSRILRTDSVSSVCVGDGKSRTCQWHTLLWRVIFMRSRGFRAHVKRHLALPKHSWMETNNDCVQVSRCYIYVSHSNFKIFSVRAWHFASRFILVFSLSLIHAYISISSNGCVTFVQASSTTQTVAMIINSKIDKVRTNERTFESKAKRKKT